MPRRDAAAARRLAERQAHLVQRLVDRLGACLPEQIDPAALIERGHRALYYAAQTGERPETLPELAVEAIWEALRSWLGASEWYREAMLGRAEPLLRTQRALALAGRPVTDRALCRRLRITRGQLAETLQEFATLFALEPKALLPAGADVKYSMAGTIARLPTEQQLAVALYFHQQLTFPEMAKVMDLEPERVQECFGRAAAQICAEASLASWPGPKLLA